MKVIYEAIIKIKVEEDSSKKIDILSKKEIDNDIKEALKNEFSNLSGDCMSIESKLKISK